MSANPYQTHVLVLPEDDANRQLANGFQLDQSFITRQIQVLQPAGGWAQVLDHFDSDHVVGMSRYPNRFMVLLIDFDRDMDRLGRAKARIPAALAERVFVLGVLSEPEALRKANLGSFEDIGMAMAADCREQSGGIWDHELLRHNSSELDHLRERVCPQLFRPI
jgi:hypothetical protein